MRSLSSITMEKIFVPDDFYCPITGDLMVDPVSEPNGHSYEKESILRWLSTKKESPMTREPLDESQLTDNISLRRSIESIRERLTDDQFKVESRISEQELQPFIDTLDGIEVKSYYLDDKLFVNINTPNVEVRPPVDIVLCIDVSGSMGTEAKLKGEANETVSHGFSILSLTVAAAKTVLASLNENDNISIVTYTDKAKVIVEQISCTTENKGLIVAQLDAIRPLNTTNMWDGIQVSMDILRTKSPPTKNKGILLLTDGIPNIEPSRGHVRMLERYYEQHQFKCMISCYGFGYDLRSDLLLDISNISGGDGYSFIPDASLLGNIFIHGISNLITTAISYPKLSIQLSKNVKFKGVEKADKLEIEIDSLKYGKEKNFMFHLDTRGCESRSLSYLIDCSDISLTINEKVFNVSMCSGIPRNYYDEQVTRYKAVDMINACLQKLNRRDRSFESELNDFCRELEEYSSDYVRNILFDMDGQVKEALNMTMQGERENWFNKWGIHYLRSLQNAYQNEICNNFKDKGVSNFSEGIFENIRDEVSDIFDDLPPPKKDVVQTSVMRGRTAVQSPSPPVSMRTYNNASGGCCAEDSTVLMEDGSNKLVQSIMKGDKVQTKINGYIGSSEVECVIKTRCNNGKENMVTLGNLRITPYHPVLEDTTWDFPINKGDVEEVDCESMYTFIIKNRGSILVDNYLFATYGHKLQGDIIGHEYFGTENIINDLKKLEGYGEGYITLTKNMFKRKNDLVYKIE